MLVFAVGSLAPGGGGIAELSRQAVHVLRELAREAHFELQLHVLDDGGPADGDPLFAGAGADARWYAGSRWRFVLGLLGARPDLLLFDHVGLARVHALAAPVLRRPYLLMIHSVEIWRSNRADYGRAAHRARLLIANSEYTARKARERYPDLPGIRVCWPGKDRPLCDADPSKSPTRGIGSMAMLIVGRMDGRQRHKGHDELMEAMPLLLQQAPQAQLVVAGEGDDRARLEARAAALGVAHAILFVGRVSEAALQDLYRRCALYVMPSDGDGFGMVFLEAMMHGLPCVGLSGGAAQEIFDDGACGVLVDRSDPAAMAGCLARLLLDDARRQALGEAGRERYRCRFTRDHYAQRLKPIVARQLERLA